MRRVKTLILLLAVTGCLSACVIVPPPYGHDHDHDHDHDCSYHRC